MPVEACAADEMKVPVFLIVALSPSMMMAVPPRAHGNVTGAKLVVKIAVAREIQRAGGVVRDGRWPEMKLLVVPSPEIAMPTSGHTRSPVRAC